MSSIKISMSVIKSTTAIKTVRIYWAPLSVAVMRASFLLMMEKIALVSHYCNYYSTQSPELIYM